MKAPWNLLGQNLLLAIQTFRIQQALLGIIAAAGPATTAELVAWAKYRLPSVLPGTVRRRLTQLRKARAVLVYPISGDPADGVMWAVPGQAKPTNLAARRRTLQPAVARRRPEVVRESWWAQPTREAFIQAKVHRWNG